MQTDTTPNSTPPSTTDAADDDEFSGLHDLKELANSARARSRRATSQGDSEIASLASTSASFKAVALPNSKTDLGVQVVTPNTVALAPKGSVPAKPPLRAQGTKVDQVFVASAPVSDASAASASFESITRPAAPAPATAEMAVSPAISSFGSSVASNPPTRAASGGNNKKLWLTVAGVFAAAALGGLLWATIGTGKAPIAATTKETTVAQAVAIAAPSALEPAVIPAADPTTVVQAPEQLIDVGASVPKDKVGKLAAKTAAAEVVAAPAAVPAIAPKAATSTGDKSIDDLLSDASSRTGIVDREAEAEQRKIERTELSRSDIKKAFGAVSPAASGCYKKHKEAGTVAVRVTVMPSGKVTKVTASGAFAGTPTGDCVVAATQGASFPEWDGSQTTLSYSFLLGE
ncbi:MAG: hypothetical protein IPL79_05490 [Myxococcales bacterium]|nr:hypothetical protein [Myxococcales bacterium]